MEHYPDVFMYLYGCMCASNGNACRDVCVCVVPLELSLVYLLRDCERARKREKCIDVFSHACVCLWGLRCRMWAGSEGLVDHNNINNWSLRCRIWWRMLTYADVCRF